MSNQADPAVAAPQFIAAKPWADMLAAVESNEFAARTAKHLSEDLVFWLTTVTPSGLPSPNPVWFLWDGASTIRTFAMADGARIRNLRRNPRVSLNFPGNAFGFDIVVLTGTAMIDTQAPAADALPEFVSKYAEWFPRANQTPASYAAQYVMPVVITLSR